MKIFPQEHLVSVKHGIDGLKAILGLSSATNHCVSNAGRTHSGRLYLGRPLPRGLAMTMFPRLRSRRNCLGVSQHNLVHISLAALETVLTADNPAEHTYMHTSCVNLPGCLLSYAPLPLQSFLMASEYHNKTLGDNQKCCRKTRVCSTTLRLQH